MASFDRKGRKAEWDAGRKAEVYYNAQLRRIARQIGILIDGIVPGGVLRDPLQLAELDRTLSAYADLIKPWARSVAGYMLADVKRRTDRTWRNHSQEMGRRLRIELEREPTGLWYRELMDENVALIQSLPTKAAQRVQHLARESLITGKRASETAKEIAASGKVAASRATLIARTETARASSTLVQVRARQAGSQGYVWRTSRDASVRETHRAMEGVYVPWDDPPKTDPGLDPYHAGCGPNCRCYPEPVFPQL